MSSRGVRLYQRCFRQFSQGTGGVKTASPPPKASIPDAKGLSDAVIDPASKPVGPNVENDKSGDYKVPEYFRYHTMSYYEAEIEMSRYRLPQPSSLK